MRTIASLNDKDRPQAPEGYRYSYTLSWTTQSENQARGPGYKKVLRPDGSQVAEGVGTIPVSAMELPATVHVYIRIEKPFDS